MLISIKNYNIVKKTIYFENFYIPNSGLIINKKYCFMFFTCLKKIKIFKKYILDVDQPTFSKSLKKKIYRVTLKKKKKNYTQLKFYILVTVM